jgi:hypothetical protein
MKINENEATRIAEFASHCIEQDIRDRHGLLLYWALIPPATREIILKKWQEIIVAVIASELRKPPTEMIDSEAGTLQTP